MPIKHEIGDTHSLRLSLREAFEIICFGMHDELGPPYRVPCVIAQDLFDWTTTHDKVKAHQIIEDAVNKA